jgi:hypothetical protein
LPRRSRPGDRARQQQLALGAVLAQVRRAHELGARLVSPAEADEQVAAHARQQVIAAQRGVPGERLDQLQPGLRAERHRHRDGAVATTGEPVSAASPS